MIRLAWAAVIVFTLGCAREQTGLGDTGICFDSLAALRRGEFASALRARTWVHPNLWWLRFSVDGGIDAAKSPDLRGDGKALAWRGRLTRNGAKWRLRLPDLSGKDLDFEVKTVSCYTTLGSDRINLVFFGSEKRHTLGLVALEPDSSPQCWDYSVAEDRVVRCP